MKSAEDLRVMTVLLKATLRTPGLTPKRYRQVLEVLLAEATGKMALPKKRRKSTRRNHEESPLDPDLGSRRSAG